MGGKILNEAEQIVKAAVEADASHEFITNLSSEMKPKLARETPNYLVYGNKLLLLLGRYYSNHRLYHWILINKIFVAIHQR
ncbi:hypothetical protein V1477_021141 [Vespula maculifrons]|uniref:Uncharacterized protein n=1 Tax=Vespula maculifrons TaxID=7453 RepID=A0ABD2AH91_VESMC